MTTTTLLWVFIVIVVLIAGAFLALAMTVRKLKQRYEDLEARFQELKDRPLKEKVEEVNQMHLVGQSLTIYRKWEEHYNEVLAEETELQSDFEEITETLESYKYIKHTREFLDYLEARIGEISDHVDKISQGLTKLQESEQENSERVQASIDLLQSLARDVRENPDSFGVALPEVRKQLHHVQESFERVDKLNQNGDPLEARQSLVKAEKEVNAASELFNAIPELNKVLTSKYVEQLEDLRAGYSRLVHQQFKFPKEEGNLSEHLEAAQMHVDDAVNSLKRCDIDVVETSVRHIAEEIDHLYAVMQREVDAQSYVFANQEVIEDFINHAHKNNRQLIIELDHTSQSYIFHQNELGRARVFQTEIENLQHDNNVWDTEIASHDAIYSEVESFYKEAFNILEDIENQQVAMDKTVQKMRSDYKKAEKAFDEFDFKMRFYKRFVEKHRLPGLPSDYLDYFFLVTEHIENLGAELAKMRVDTAKLNEYVEALNNEVREVAKRTNNVVDHATLAEQYMQYANRFRSTHDIAPAINESLELFKEYRYTEAMNNIKLVIERIDPGATDRIKSFYDEEKEAVD